METLQKDIISMKEQKMTLFVSTTAFRRNLLDLLGNNSHGGREKTAKTRDVKSAGSVLSSEGGSSTSVLNRVAEFQNVMADLYLQQAEADEMLYFLSLDYRLRDISRHNILPFSHISRRILVAVDIALARRRKALKSLQKEIKKSGSTKV